MSTTSATDWSSWGGGDPGRNMYSSARGLPDTSTLYNVDRQPSITYLDRNGALIATRGTQMAPPADLDSLPDYVPAAFIAIEDQNFWWHPGFNPWGILRSQVYNVTHAGKGVPKRG